jgi:hypothetical protein
MPSDKDKYYGHGIHGIHGKINDLKEIFPCSSVDSVAIK